ncbi:MAG: ATP-binding protein [Gammaproteobacteria bacterium]
MSEHRLSGHGPVMLRSYLLLVAGLLVVAVVLDLGFRSFVGEDTHGDETWLRTTLQLVENTLAQTTGNNYEQALGSLRVATGLNIDLWPRDTVSRSVESEGDLDWLRDEKGSHYVLYAAPKLDSLIRVGPIPIAPEPLRARLLPALFYLSIFIVAGWWLRPLLLDVNRMTDAAQRFAADYREPLSTAKSTTRLTSLAQNLDDMSARLSGMIQTQKELIAALSHEMRTPLSRVRFGLATLDREDEQAHREQVSAINDDVQDVDLLIGTMLNYARLDHPDLRMNWLSVPLSSWLQETTQKAVCDGVALEVGAPDAPGALFMDPRLMGLALSNLLSNALRHADTTVSCHAELVDGWAQLVVADDGAGIPADQRDKALKAFARLDDSRNRDTGGFGLGLAIVARIAALHGGTVDVGESEELGGARFVVTWPAKAPSD